MNIHNLEQSAMTLVSELKGKPENWTAAATWMAQEKGWAWWENPQPGFNVLNITDGHGGFQSFPTLYYGIAAAVTLLENGISTDPTIYHPIVQAFQTGTPEDVLKALSESPWCKPPYPLVELEGVLKMINENAQPLDVQTQAKEAEIATIEKQISDLQTQLSQKQSELASLQQSGSTSTEKFVDVTQSQPNNTLWGIMVEQGKQGNAITLSDLYRLNPGVNPTHLQVGQKIRVV